VEVTKHLLIEKKTFIVSWLTLKYKNQYSLPLKHNLRHFINSFIKKQREGFGVIVKEKRLEIWLKKKKRNKRERGLKREV
jgi:hypothetical protein